MTYKKLKAYAEALDNRTGKPLTKLEQLALLATKKRSVICPRSGAWDRPRPAAFMMNLPGSVLLNLFAIGMYEYRKGGAR